MHKITKPFDGITVYDRAGGERRFDTAFDLVAFYGQMIIRLGLGAHFRVYSHCALTFDDKDRVVAWERHYNEYEYIARGADGMAYGAEDLLFMHSKQAMAEYRALGPWRLRGWSGTGPVPHTGNRSYGRYYRKPKTFQARKMAQRVDPMEPAVRPGRNARSLPSNWDDLVSQSYRDRSWKRYRRQQWK